MAIFSLNQFFAAGRPALNPGLCLLLACVVPAFTPTSISYGTAGINELKLSTLVQKGCDARQTGSLAGAVVYHKGLATLNGFTPTASAQIRIGDTITTAHDGFIALDMGYGKPISIQPVTHLTVDCALNTNTLHNWTHYKSVDPNARADVRS